MTTTKVPSFKFAPGVKFPTFKAESGALKGALDRNLFVARHDPVCDNMIVTYNEFVVLRMPNLTPIRFVAGSQSTAQAFDDGFLLSGPTLLDQGYGGNIDILIPGGRCPVDGYQIGGGKSCSWCLTNGSWDSYLNIGVMYEGTLVALLDAVAAELVKNAAPDWTALEDAYLDTQATVEAAYKALVKAERDQESVRTVLGDKDSLVKSARTEFDAAVEKRNAAEAAYAKAKK